MSKLTVTVATPAGPEVPRTFEVTGNLSIEYQPTNRGPLVDEFVMVQFGVGGPVVGAEFLDAWDWRCVGTVNSNVPPGTTIEVSVTARGTVQYFFNPEEPGEEYVSDSKSVFVRVAAKPTVAINPVPSVVASQLPVTVNFTGSASGGFQTPLQLVQYAVEGGAFANVNNPLGNWTQWNVVLPVPPGAHTLTVCATDVHGYQTTTSASFTVPSNAPPVEPGTRVTLRNVPTTSSITSWTRLEPQSTNADMGVTSSARVFDPLWLMARQWQMGEFQAEDAGTPVKARVRATSAQLTRLYLGELPPTPPASTPRYNPVTTPLEAVVERRRMRPKDATDPRMMTFAVEAGLHFLHMLERQSLSKSYRPAMIAKFALQAPPDAALAAADDATVRFVRTTVGRAPDARLLAQTLRSGGGSQLVLDPALDVAAADRPKMQDAANAWLTWYDTLFSESGGGADDAWIPSRFEYAMSVATHLSTAPADEVTFSANEHDGGRLDWSSFDLNAATKIVTAGDDAVKSRVEMVIPAPVTFRGAPAVRFWELEDARVAYGLQPVGPTDLVQLMLVEYASSYGNDWFVVPLTVDVGSVTRVDSLVVTDTFGVRTLLRPMGDAALPPPYFSMWQPAYLRRAGNANAGHGINKFFLPPTLGTTLDSAPLEDVLLMRDEMANMAWGIERTVESPIEQPLRRTEHTTTSLPSSSGLPEELPRYRLSSSVESNWIPFLPVLVEDAPGHKITRLKRGLVLQADGSRAVHPPVTEVLSAAAPLLLFDEEVPREGIHLTRRRSLARWSDGSTWLWTSLQADVGTGEGSSGLRFDQVIDKSG